MTLPDLNVRVVAHESDPNDDGGAMVIARSLGGAELRVWCDHDNLPPIGSWHTFTPVSGVSA